MTKMLTSDLAYSFGGTRMLGYFAIAADGPARRPGVLIVPDAFGLESHCFGVAERLAGIGFAALALDLWGNRRQFSDPASVMSTMADLRASPENWMGRVEAARQALIAQAGVDGSRIAAIGYCLGGSTVLEYARRGGDVSGIVSFHGGLDLIGTEWDSTTVRAKLLVCTGAEDPLVPWSALSGFQDNLRQGGVNWEIALYGGARHSFTRPDAAARSDPERSRHDPQADRRSWRAMRDFLGEIFEGWNELSVP